MYVSHLYVYNVARIIGVRDSSECNELSISKKSSNIYIHIYLYVCEFVTHPNVRSS